MPNRDYSTIDFETLRALPYYQMPAGNRLTEFRRSYNDYPPGFPAYFEQKIRTVRSDEPKNGPKKVIQDPTTGKLYVTDDASYGDLWVLIALPAKIDPEKEPEDEDELRVYLWMRKQYDRWTYQYACPAPDHFFTWNPQANLLATTHWQRKALEIARKKGYEQYVSLDNHKAVLEIRRYYPEHEPILAWIDTPPGVSPEEKEEFWWIRWATRFDWLSEQDGNDLEIFPDLSDLPEVDEALYPVHPTIMSLLERNSIDSSIFYPMGEIPEYVEEKEKITPWTAIYTYGDGVRELRLPYWTHEKQKGDVQADVIMAHWIDMAKDLEGYPLFEDWAAEFGYDTDSRMRECQYNANKTICQQLEAFLGDLYPAFLDAD